MNESIPIDRSMQVSLIVLSALWLAYFSLHSILASLGLKQWIARRHPRLMPAYRMGYNALALLLLIPPLWLTVAFSGPWLWRWQGTGYWIANGLALLAVLGFMWSLRYYDGQEFLGLRQWRLRQDSALDQERFHLSPLHRYVRHPWYFLALVILWSRDMNAAWLVSVSLVTLYFIVGSRLEEIKLIQYHGEVYKDYRRRVSGLVPLPWRFLSKKAASDLVLRYRSAGVTTKVTDAIRR
jgi:protein-S-isoprenylcysteine O-methyltransferase Ste14